MIVFRIEDADGVCPFISGLDDIHDDAAERAGEPYGMFGPSPPEDGLEEAPRHYVYGCERLDDLRRWWFPSPAGCLAMTDAGVRLVTFELALDDVCIGGTQVAFDAQKATRIHAQPASDLYGGMEGLADVQ